MRPAMEDTTGYPPLDVLKPVAENIWVVDSEPLHPAGIAMPVRMTVIRLRSGALWLHSPTRLDGDLYRALIELGPVRHLVAPNIAHWSFVQEWQRHCPEAITWAAPELGRRRQVKRSGLRIDRVLEGPVPESWGEDIEMTIVPGGGGFREVAFCHPATRTLILTDLIVNLEPERVPAGTRVFARLTGTLAPHANAPVYLRFSLLLRRRDAAKAVARMLDWRPERVIFAHGRWFESDGTAALERSLGWLIGKFAASSIWASCAKRRVERVAGRVHP